VTDPLELATDSLGDAPCDDATPPPPISTDVICEQEVAAAVARMFDSMAQLTKLLPLDASAGQRFRRSIYSMDSDLCGDDGILEDNEDG
jgi:hypothetical protein